MFNPTFLQKGDRVGIVSTARKVTKREIELSILLIERWGLIPVLGETIGLKMNQFAGDDEVRVSDLQRMLDDPTISAIWCARGGYGTIRVVDLLGLTFFKKKPKWIIGYSDITILHSHIHNLGIATMHAPMPIDLHQSSNEAIDAFQEVLFGKQVHYPIPFSKYNRKGKGQGELVGGNLSILYSLCGSQSAMNTNGKILIIEDLDEYLYHIDRMMHNLKRNGMLEGLKGLIVGGMTQLHDNKVPFGKTVEEIILESVNEYEYPVIFDFPMGHVKDNYTLVLGAEVTVEVSEDEVFFDVI